MIREARGLNRFTKIQGRERDPRGGGGESHMMVAGKGGGLSGAERQESERRIQ